eukprot:365694-Chlamydomonas_euryale.AAC.9
MGAEGPMGPDKPQLESSRSSQPGRLHQLKDASSRLDDWTTDVWTHTYPNRSMRRPRFRSHALPRSRPAPLTPSRTAHTFPHRPHLCALRAAIAGAVSRVDRAHTRAIHVEQNKRAMVGHHAAALCTDERCMAQNVTATSRQRHAWHSSCCACYITVLCRER